ncbi:hypothetical protein VTO73DRAFT_589 [Trametes versicolor]
MHPRTALCNGRENASRPALLSVRNRAGHDDARRDMAGPCTSTLNPPSPPLQSTRPSARAQIRTPRHTITLTERRPRSTTPLTATVYTTTQHKYGTYLQHRRTDQVTDQVHGQEQGGHAYLHACPHSTDSAHGREAHYGTARRPRTGISTQTNGRTVGEDVPDIATHSRQDHERRGGDAAPRSTSSSI